MKKQTIEDAKKYRDAISETIGLTQEQIFGKTRKHPIPVKRQIVTAFMEMAYPNIPLQDIGEAMGYARGSGHCMVLYAAKQLADLIDYGDKKTMPFYRQARNYHNDFIWARERPRGSTTERPMVTSEDVADYLAQ